MFSFLDSGDDECVDIQFGEDSEEDSETVGGVFVRLNRGCLPMLSDDDVDPDIAFKLQLIYDTPFAALKNVEIPFYEPDEIGDESEDEETEFSIGPQSSDDDTPTSGYTQSEILAEKRELIRDQMKELEEIIIEVLENEKIEEL